MSVGKSCVLTRFADDQFTESYVTTIGVDFRFKTMVLGDKIVKVQVWDTAGQERYRSITNAYYRGAEAIMIIFDLTSKDSFGSVENWIGEVAKFAGEDVLVIVGANKTDLNYRNVSREEVEEFSNRKGIKVFEISAKSGQGVEDAFKYMVQQLIEKKSSKDVGEGRKMKLLSSLKSGNNNCCWT